MHRIKSSTQLEVSEGVDLTHGGRIMRTVSLNTKQTLFQKEVGY